MCRSSGSWPRALGSAVGQRLARFELGEDWECSASNRPQAQAGDLAGFASEQVGPGARAATRWRASAAARRSPQGTVSHLERRSRPPGCQSGSEGRTSRRRSRSRRRASSSRADSSHGPALWKRARRVKLWAYHRLGAQFLAELRESHEVASAVPHAIRDGSTPNVASSSLRANVAAPGNILVSLPRQRDGCATR